MCGVHCQSVPAGTQTFSRPKRLFTIAFRIGSECPFIERYFKSKRLDLNGNENISNAPPTVDRRRITYDTVR